MLDAEKIPYVNWCIGDDDTPGASAALEGGTPATAVGQDSVLTASGKFIKAKLRSMALGVSCPAPAALQINVKTTATWNGGGQVDIQVVNNGDARVCSATLQLTSGRLSSFWNMLSSDQKTFTPQYQMSLAKGQSYPAGAVYEGSTPSFQVASSKTC